jgi:hypothetical protein
LPHLGIWGSNPSIAIAAPTEDGSLHHWLFSKAHNGLQIANGFQTTYVYDYTITKLCRQQAEVIQNHENALFAKLENIAVTKGAQCP